MTFLMEICAGPAPAAADSGSGIGSRDVDGEAKVQERWSFSFSPASPDQGTPERHNQTVVRKLCVSLRTLMCFTRTLPADSACRNGILSERHWRCRVQDEFEVEPLGSDWTTQEFAVVGSGLGSLRLCVSYRQDLRVKVSNGTDHASHANSMLLGSQTDDMEVEEGYVNLLDPPPPPPPPSPPAASHSSPRTVDGRAAMATPPMSAKSSPRYGPALDKIAEESEFRHDGGVPAPGKKGIGMVEPIKSPGVISQLPRSGRPRSYSNASDASTMSTSSRGPSVPDHAVVLGATPPFALAPSSAPFPPPGLLSLGPPMGGCGSACSSRSTTPHSTPKLEPQPDPSIQGIARGPAGRSRQGADRVAEHSAHSTGAAVAPRPPSPTLQGGVFDDLSDIWMNAPVERGRRRVSSPRSVDAGSVSHSREGSLKAFHRVRSPQQEPQTEIFYFGMSDDEEEDSIEAVDEEDEGAPTAGLSMLQGEGAFVLGGSTPFDAEDLGLVLDKPEHSSTVSSPILAPARAVSPLIAQLNPLLSPVMSPCMTPGLLAQGEAYREREGLSKLSQPGSLGALPVASAARGERRLSVSSRGSGSSPRGNNAAATSSAAKGTAQDQELLSEMGELMVKLQHPPDLAITCQEIDASELMERLEHFREVVDSAMMRRDM
mmetsp:Transcript_69146/g.165822  ORF Transcript_69146/g.165822 Transcript_69146/m.165822 type:complete len:658 (-) Transcript_69146:29-2002(-)